MHFCITISSVIKETTDRSWLVNMNFLVNPFRTKINEWKSIWRICSVSFRYLLLSFKFHDMRNFEKIEILCPCNKLLFSNYRYSVSAVWTLLLFVTQNLIKKCAPFASGIHCKISKFLLSTNIYISIIFR